MVKYFPTEVRPVLVQSTPTPGRCINAVCGVVCHLKDAHQQEDKVERFRIVATGFTFRLFPPQISILFSHHKLQRLYAHHPAWRVHMVHKVASYAQRSPQSRCVVHTIASVRPGRVCAV